VALWFAVCVWTASLSTYASPVIDRLDARGIISRRLYRDSCVVENGLYLKHLVAQGFPLDRTIIVDNSPLCFKTCQANGIPIESWFDSQSDCELLLLLPLLEALQYVPDVRLVLQQP
jgi:Dullard-like phosphatase family protein